jgi:hypothetical protein
MADNEPLMVECGPHGKRVASVVCCHLLSTDLPPVGFIENSDDPDDLQAWCYACEEKFEEEGGMTQAFQEFNGMSLICVVCYQETKSRHSIEDD